MSLIVTAVSAAETGLLNGLPGNFGIHLYRPADDGYTMVEDSPEGRIDVSMPALDFSTGPVWEEDEEWGDFKTMLRRAAQIRAYGGLGFTKLVLDAQKEGRNIIPRELCNRYVIILLPRTIFQNSRGDRGVARLDNGGRSWVDQGIWGVYFTWWGRYTNPFRRGALFVRPHE